MKLSDHTDCDSKHSARLKTRIRKANDSVRTLPFEPSSNLTRLRD